MIRLKAKNKYRAEKVVTGDRSFHSKLEKAVYDILLLREIAGEVSGILCQDHVYLTKAQILYIADFSCLDKATGSFIWVEAKGFESPRWPTIKKLWKFYGPGRLDIYRGSYQKPTLVESIHPVGDQ